MNLIFIVFGALIGLTGYLSINRVVTSMDTIYGTTLDGSNKGEEVA